MSKIAACLLPVVALSCLPGFLGIGRGEDKPERGTLAHFRFNGDGKDANPDNPEFELKNTAFRDNALYLNGIYELGKSKDGYRAACKTSKLDYNTFTVALRFKAEEFGADKRTLLMAGPSHRWFGLERSAAGKLTVNLNNGHQFEINDAALEAGKWTVVACGVDLPNRKVVVYLNGKLVATNELPKDFQLGVIDSKAKDNEKAWTFANYGSGSTFHGLVDELIIYGKMLSAEEFAKIPLRP